MLNKNGERVELKRKVLPKSNRILVMDFPGLYFVNTLTNKIVNHQAFGQENIENRYATLAYSIELNELVIFDFHSATWENIKSARSERVKLGKTGWPTPMMVSSCLIVNGVKPNWASNRLAYNDAAVIEKAIQAYDNNQVFDNNTAGWWALYLEIMETNGRPNSHNDDGTPELYVFEVQQESAFNIKQVTACTPATMVIDLSPKTMLCSLCKYHNAKTDGLCTGCYKTRQRVMYIKRGM